MWHFWYNDPSNIDPCQNTKPSLSLHGLQWSERYDKMKQNQDIPQKHQSRILQTIKSLSKPLSAIKKGKQQ